ncbi:MAG: hypothetical protein KC731_16770 [Myxococcales bacterium]|nr:hypothetical protein [Myxococcales bacterium]
MMENRSFDNMLGWLYSYRPPHFIPDTPMARFNGLQGLDPARFANPVVLANNQVAYLPPTRGFTPTTMGSATYLAPPPRDPHEEFEHMSRQIYGPWDRNRPPLVGPTGNAPPGAVPTMDSFATDYQNAIGVTASQAEIARVMECATYAQAYPLSILAQAYAVSDAWYSSAPTQTNPNRAFMACGTSQGLVNNASDGIDRFTAPTLWNRLTSLGKSWKIYWENTYLPEVGRQPWTRQCFTQLNGFGDDHFPRMGAFHRDAKLGKLPFFSFIEPSWTLEKAFAGSLEGFQGSDMHPPGDIRPGLQFLSAIYTSLVSNPAAWAKTLLLITFDEHGGTYDHVPPPHDVTPDQAHATGFRFDRVGPRVPTVLVSPMVEPGTVFRSTKPRSGGRSFPYDHTSIPATILKLAGATPDQYGLFDRVKVAPTFEGVLRRAGNPRSDFCLGEAAGEWEREPEATDNDLVRYGDSFRLRYASPGAANGWYVTGASTADGSDLWLTPNVGEAFPFRFTLGYSGQPGLPANAFVRTTGLVYLQWAASWPPDSQNHGYVRVPDDVFRVARYCELGADDGWWYSQWYITNAERRLLGWGLPWGAQVTLEYRALNSSTHWLPRKMIPYATDRQRLAVADDADYASPGVGRWIIERVTSLSDG